MRQGILWGEAGARVRKQCATPTTSLNGLALLALVCLSLPARAGVELIDFVIAPEPESFWAPLPLPLTSADPPATLPSACLAATPAMSQLDCLAFMAGAASPTTEPAEYGKLIQSAAQLSGLGTDLFGDRVNLYTGKLQFVQEDVSLSGNSALPVRVARRFEEGRGPVALGGHFGDWDFDIPHLHGVFASTPGWKVPGTPPLHSDQRCTNFGAPPEAVASQGAGGHFAPGEFWHGTFLYLPETGDQQVLDILSSSTVPLPTDSPSGGYRAVTRDGAALSCESLDGTGGHTGEGFRVRTPDGRIYHFTHMVQRPATRLYKNSSQNLYGTSTPTSWGDYYLNRSEYWILPTQIEDRYGNAVTYTWNAAKPWRLDRIDSLNVGTDNGSDVRTIEFSYDTGDNYLIKSAVVRTKDDGTRTWNYTYSGGHLSAVELPDHSQWTFPTLVNLATSTIYTQAGPQCDGLSLDVIGEGAPLEGEMTHPSGAKATFRTEPKVRGRSQVIRNCDGPDKEPTLLAVDPYLYAVRAIAWKKLEGPGLGEDGLTWTYAYGAANACWNPNPLPGETPMPPGTACTSGSPLTVTTTVTDPAGDATRYTFGNKYDLNEPTEGQLQKLEEGFGGTTTRTTETTYAARTSSWCTGATGRCPWPAQIGDGEQPRGDSYAAEHYTPERKRTVVQDGGASFTWEATDFDARARVESVTRSSSLPTTYGPNSRTEATTYHDDASIWVLNQIATVTETSVTPNRVVVESGYWESTANLKSRKRFGVWEYKELGWYDDGTLESTTDALGHSTVYSGYQRGIPQGIAYPGGGGETANVTDLGRIEWHEIANARTTYAYDGMNRITGVYYPTASPPWNPTLRTFKQVLSASDQDADDPGYDLDFGYWRVTETTGTGTTRTWYDALWRPVVTRRYDSTSDTTEDATERTVLHEYDHAGRVTFESYPVRDLPPGTLCAGFACGVTTEYDALGRTRFITADTEQGDAITQITYGDSLNPFRKTVTDPLGRVTATTFQAFDRPGEGLPVWIEAPGNATTDVATTTITRNVFGQPRAMTRSGKKGSTATSVSAVRKYVYDGHQRLCKTIEPESGATLIHYRTASNGDPDSLVDWRVFGSSLNGDSTCDNDENTVPLALRTAYTYDARNRLAGTASPGGPSVTQSWTVDNLLAGTSRGGITWSYQYNNRRLLENEVLLGIDVITHLYNANGHERRLRYVDEIDWAPNALGEPTAATKWSDDDGNGVLESEVLADGVTWHANGALAEFAYGNGLIHATSQNLRGLPWVSQDTGSVLDDEYTWDKNGNPTLIGSSVSARPNRTLGYDRRDRLISALYGAPISGTYTYEYDALDNLYKQSLPGGSTYTHSYTSNRLTSLAAGARGDNYTYGYGGVGGERGNVTSRISSAVPADSRRFVWSGDNRLAKVTNASDAFIASYDYDGHGRRVWVRDNDQRRLTIYATDGKLLIDRAWPTQAPGCDAAGERVFCDSFEPATVNDTRNVYLGNHMIARRTTQHADSTELGTRFIHSDGLGSVVAETNGSGAIVGGDAARRLYAPFGEPIRPLTNPWADVPGFTGHMMDSSAWLVHMQQRYHDPLSGAMLSVDPVPVDTATGWNFNRYNYAANSPFKNIDPDGREPCSGFGCSTYVYYFGDGGRSEGGESSGTSAGDYENCRTMGCANPTFTGAVEDARELGSDVSDFGDELVMDTVKWGWFGAAAGKILGFAVRAIPRLNAFERAGIETTEHFRNRLAQRAGRGITERNALDAYQNGRLYYNEATGNYIRHSSRTGVSVVTDAPSGGRAITVFEGNPSPGWNPVPWRPGQ